MYSYSSSILQRQIMFEWSFKKRNGNDILLAHKMHRYPAMFLPEVVEKLIYLFSDNHSPVLDMFAGSGTSLLEAQRLGRKVIGFDINPLALLIAKVKNTVIPKDDLETFISALNKVLAENPVNKSSQGDFSLLTNADYWFHPVTLTSIKDIVVCIKTLPVNKLVSSELSKFDEKNIKDMQDFVLVALSEIIRDVSYCNTSGFKLHRDKKKVENPIVLDIAGVWNKVQPILERNINANTELNNYRFKNEFTLYNHDSRVIHPDIAPESIGFIVTSPPYGDSKTTVAYGQFSSLSCELFGLKSKGNKSPRNIDNELLGGLNNEVGDKRTIDVDTLRDYSITLQNAQTYFFMADKASPDEKFRQRLKDILSFYDDMNTVMKNAAYYLKKDGIMAMVVSPRIIKGYKLQTEIILSEMADLYGLTLKNIYTRDILNKRMPSKVCSSNVKGTSSPTMTKESILVFHKEK